MTRSRKSFTRIINGLRSFYGAPQPPKVTDPFEMILLENVAYLVPDEQRDRAFEELRNRVGLSAAAIFSASDEELLQVARLGGMHPDSRVNKLRSIAQIVLREFENDLNAVIGLPPPQAKKALKKFPGIGDPGAEKILLFGRRQQILALDSNGLRVLTRLGFTEEKKSYAATYRSAQESVKEDLKEDFDWLIAAHKLLQRHGRELCKTTQPLCAQCSLKQACSFYESVKERSNHV